MAITLAQIPGFADVADSNFATEQFAIGLNFQRTIDNAKFGVVRPEVFVGKYINGDTVSLPTSTVDGYTYSREELTYIYHYALSGGTSPGNNGAATGKGAIRYMNAYVNQLTGAVSTSVEYLVADGSGPTVTSDGTLEVFTLATRRLTSLVVAAPPVFASVDDAEMSTDKAITESLMQRINRNAKFAALRSEIIYMGEFTDGDTVPQPVSPSDGYVYSYGETTFQYCWRWTTQGDQFVDPTNNNYKQIQDIAADIDVGTGLVHVLVTYYNSGYYPTNNGRISVFAFCQRTIPSGIGAGAVDFVDLSPDFLASGRDVRYDVLVRQVQNTRYAMLRREFFRADYFDGQTVALPVSPVDGYQYSRDELTYVYDFNNTGPGGTQGAATDIRINNWNCTIDQTTGNVTLTIIRVHDGGGLVTTHNGQVRVLTVARRNHAGNSQADFPYEPGAGTGGIDFSALQDGGFDSWNKPTDQTAQAWSIYQQSGAGYGAQSPGLISGFSQRLGIGPSSTPQPPVTSSSNQSNTPHYISTLSSSITAVSGNLIYVSFVCQPSVADLLGLTLTVFLYDAIGDSHFFVLEYDTVPLPDGTTQVSGWFQVPNKGDTTVATNMSNAQGTGVVGMDNGAVVLDFVPSTMRLEFYYAGALNTYVDLDEVTLINQTDPSVGQVAQRGSSSLAFFPAIPWTVTDTEFTPDLTFNIQRVDGTITPVTDGSAVTVTGLTQSTDYKWYPYLNERTRHALSVTTGGVGTPPWLQTAATRALYTEWYSLANLPFAAAPLDVTTLATPTGGGSAPPAGGSGGGDDGCLHESMLVREYSRGIIKASEVRLGDVLKSKDGMWLDVLCAKHASHMDWVEVKWSHGGKLRVTAGHPFQTEDGEVVRAWSLTVQHLIPWEKGVCSPVSIKLVRRMGCKVKITLTAPHVFYAGADPKRMTLTHNMNLPTQSTL